MKDVFVVLLSLAGVAGLFYLRIKQSSGWIFMPRKKLLSLFPSAKEKRPD